MQRILPIIALNIAFFVLPLFGHAQTAPALLLEPEYPQAGELYTATLQNPYSNNSSVRWFINGSEKADVKNDKTISLKAGEVGVATSILTRITKTDGSIEEVAHTVIPTRVDLIIEADTLVPPSYSGKKLPSSGSTLQATALIFTKEKRSSKEYSYLWKVNGKVQNGGAFLGENTLSYTPSFENEIRLSVDIFDRSGKIVAQKVRTIPVVKPELVFYEKNPLRGVSGIALSSPYQLIGEEITIRAEGYFMSNDNSSSNVLKEWKIDGKVKQTENSEEILLTKKGISGSSIVSFHVRNLQQLLQGVERGLTIEF